MDQEVWAPLDTVSSMETATQTTYSPKFVAYLARLLINYDYASLSWWERRTMNPPTSAQRIGKLLASQGFEGTFAELDADGDSSISREELLDALSDADVQRRREKELFAEFEASVNLGLLRYQGREGVPRLVGLLRSQFGIDRPGKRQLALLFSLMDELQPVQAIKQLIGEAEGSTVVGFNVTYPGFGYDMNAPPAVYISPSPGTNQTAVASVRLAPTGRLLKIVLDKPMGGFTSVPKVEITPPAQGTRAVCIPKMNGDAIERLILSNPGSGYTEEDSVSVYIAVDGQPLPWSVPQARPVLEMRVEGIEVEDGGGGYAHDLPITVEVDKPPDPVSAAATAKVSALLSEPPENLVRSWLPSSTMSTSLKKLLPNNLVPKYDPCLKRFFLSPVEELDPNYCIYFEDEFKVVPSSKFNKYFSFLDGPKARNPVEKERDLDATVFGRFALSGALCCGGVHALLVPLDVIKTKMQADPARYPTVLKSAQRIQAESGLQGLLLGAGATIVGYVVYGCVSFGLTEYFKRAFLQVAGPELATYFPFAILLLASMAAAIFGAVAVTPFEALRIRAVTADANPAFQSDKTLMGSITRVVRERSFPTLFAGLGPAVVGEIPFMTAKFAVFDAVSKFIYDVFPQASESLTLSLAVSLLGGMAAGVVAAIVSHPFDTITTKVTQYSQQGRGGVWDAVKDIYSQGGPGGFFKGTVPRAVKSAANIALQFFLYDWTKRALHVSSDDLKLFFDVMSGLEVSPGTSAPPPLGPGGM